MKDSELEDFFSADPVNEVEETPEITPEPDAEPATVEEATSEEAPVEEAAVEEPAKTDSMVPLAALTAERNKARDTRDALDALKAEFAQLRQQMAPAPVQQPQQAIVGQNGIPDPFDNPTGYHEYVMQQAAQQAQQMFVNQQVQMSRARAVEKHGQDAVTEAADWFAEQVRENPTLEHKALSQPDVAEWVIAQKKRSDALKTFETDPDAYVRQRALELGLATPLQPEIVVSPPAAKDTGPKSLVSAQSATTSVSPKQQAIDAFDAMFNR